MKHYHMSFIISSYVEDPLKPTYTYHECVSKGEHPFRHMDVVSKHLHADHKGEGFGLILQSWQPISDVEYRLYLKIQEENEPEEEEEGANESQDQ